MATIEDLKAWVARDLSRYSRIEDHIEVTADQGNSTGSERRYTFRIYTDLHRYTITARNPEPRKYPDEAVPAERKKLSVSELEALMSDSSKFIELAPDGFAVVRPAVTKLDGGYLGCTSSCRKPRAGEDWHRGSDLSDGLLTEDTWRSILGDIISYEMVRVHRRADAERLAGIAPTPVVGPSLGADTSAGDPAAGMPATISA